MAKSIFLCSVVPNTGKSALSLGIIDTLLTKTDRVGYFKPIIDTEGEDKEYSIELMLNFFRLNQSYDESYSFAVEEVANLLENGKQEQVVNQIINDYKILEERFDVVLIDGSDFSSENQTYEFNLNAEIAHNIGAPVVLVGRGKNRDKNAATRQIKLAFDALTKKDVEVIGVILNRVNPTEVESYWETLRSRLGGTGKEKLFSTIPEIDVLGAPTMQEVAKSLDATVIFGEDQLNAKQMHRISVAGMQLPNFLEFLTENCVVVAASDRGDIIVGTLQANASENYPSISGLILTGPHEMDDSINRLIDGLHRPIPVLRVPTNTFNTAVQLSEVQSKLAIDYPLKVTSAIKAFDKYVDKEHLFNKISSFQSNSLTPKMFKYQLTRMAKKDKKHIVLPEGIDDRILQATEYLIKEDIVSITLIGEQALIEERIKHLGLDIPLTVVDIIDPEQHTHFSEYAKALYEARKHKNVTINIAEDLMTDASYFGTMMVQQGDADGMVSGAINTTQHTIRPALQFVKTKPNVNVVSSVFFMCLEDRVLVYGDCAVNPNPTAEQLAEIAISSSDTAKRFGIEPKIAMLSYSSGESGKGEEVDKVRTATKIVKELRPDLLIEGPIQYDAAVDVTTGQKKLPGSSIAGKANVLIFPDLNTGNNTYKAVQRETKALAIGPVLQGLNKPVNDLSRGCTVEDIINTVIITAIQAQSN